MAETLPSNSNDDNRIIVNGYDGCYERVDDYRKGGNHPVHLGSRVGNYQIVAKQEVLVHGLQWLCLDVEARKYVSLLILRADADINHSMEMKYCQKHIEGFALPTDSFDIDGPNGSHHVLVYIPMGVPFYMTDVQQDKQKLNFLCLQTTRALANLHAKEICHGCVSPYSVNAVIEGLEDLSQDKIRAQLGTQGSSELVRIDTRKPHGLDTAPERVFQALNWSCLEKEGPIRLSSKYLLDLKTAYEQSSPPKKLIQSFDYTPPEYLLEGTTGPGCDVWALGCTIYRCRMGEDLFLGNPDDDQVLFKICMTLGKPPDKWWNKWEHKDFYFQDDSLKLTEEFEHVVPRSIRKYVEEGIVLEDDIPKPEPLTPEESELFVDLLESIFKYDPASRPSMAKIAEHAWFKSQ